MCRERVSFRVHPGFPGITICILQESSTRLDSYNTGADLMPSSDPSGGKAPPIRWIAGAALLAMTAAGTIFFAPRIWNHVAKNARLINSALHSAQSRMRRQNTVIRPLSTASTNPAPRAFIKLTHSPINTTAQQPKKVSSGPNEFRLQPDAGFGQIGEETGEDPKLRADYFYRQRAY